ncbi:hypothetical protein O0880_23165 [Janthinobacterium sp. SUN118]|uniref:hypothetical protein n=1 Tax=Janthinobacterium sp. SUN118 TaxID=3004100 RepID=UPI0025B023ED|nr:hypothetical protein [Janthinobacterium sp. SUN118]MDN2712333.1 hypothetical protein [Janthinobacterium sp. SUN118]
MKAAMINRYDELQKLFRRAGCGIALLAVLSACGGGSGGGTATPPPVPPVDTPRYLLGGTVSGLLPGASVVLANGTDKVTVTANGAFSFAGKLAAGASYDGKVDSASAGLGCSIAQGAATMVSADVSTLAVRCLPIVLAGVQERIQRIDGMVQDAAGNSYFTDSSTQVIHKLAPDGSLSIYAGMPGKTGAVDGPAASATFYMSGGRAPLAIDGKANLYVADSCNGLVRKITPAGVVSTLAGKRRANCSGPQEGQDGDTAYADGAGTQARFGWITSMAMDRNDDVLLVDDGSAPVRRVTPAGVVSSINVLFAEPNGLPRAGLAGQIAVDANGVIYLSNSGGSKVYRFDRGVATLVAGNARTTGYDGKGANASFRGVRSMMFERSGNLLLADRDAIRRMTPDGEVTTVAGRVVPDATGKYLDWKNLALISSEDSGAMLVFDSSLQRLNRVDAGNRIATVPVMLSDAGSADGVGAAARVGNVRASTMCSDPAGNVYLLDAAGKVLRRLAPNGKLELYAGIAGRAGSDDGARLSATMASPVAIACGADGAVYVADRAPDAPAFNLRKINSDGVMSTIEQLPADTNGLQQYILAIDKDGYITWMEIFGEGIYRRPPGGVFSLFVSFDALTRALGDRDPGPQSVLPYSIVFDSKGEMYFDDYYHQVIFKANRSGSVTVFAGTLYSSKNIDGAPGVGSLSFAGMPSLAIDKADNLYVSGQDGVRKINPAGVISTPQLAWGNPIVDIVAFGNGTLYGYTARAIVQTPLP